MKFLLYLILTLSYTCMFTQTLPSLNLPLPLGNATTTRPIKPRVFNGCENGNLEFGDLTNWKQYCGSYNTPINNFTPCNDINRVKIENAGIDPVCGIQKVKSGSHSIKIGNVNVGAEADLAYYTFTVNNNNKKFKFRYAAVLEDPTHPTGNPDFSYFVTTGNKHYPNLSDPFDFNLFSNTIKTIIADKNNPFWKSTITPRGEVVYRDWTCVEIDLSNYIGQLVSIVFVVRDCSATGHFGYIYVDDLCQDDVLVPIVQLPKMACTSKGAPIIAYGNQSIGEEAYYWEVREVDNVTGNDIPGGIVEGDWYIGQVNSFDINQYLTTKNKKLKCNAWYNVKLAIQSGCNPWKETINRFYHYCPSIYDQPDINTCCNPLTVSCFTLGATLDEPGSNNTYNWEASDGRDVITNPNYTSQAIVCPEQTTQYTLTVTDKNGCQNSDIATIMFRGPIKPEIINNSGCCVTELTVLKNEVPCSKIDQQFNNLYPTDIKWYYNNGSTNTYQGNSTTINTNPQGGIYTVVSTNICGTYSTSVSIMENDLLNSNNVPIIAFNGDVFASSPMPIYHYNPAIYPNDPIFWLGTNAYNSEYGYRIEIYYRWNSTITSDPNQLVKIIDKKNCGRLNNGDINIDNLNKYGNPLPVGQYLFKLYIYDCNGVAYRVNNYWKRKFVCDKEKWFGFFAHSHNFLPHKDCLEFHYENIITSEPGGIFNFFVAD